MIHCKNGTFHIACSQLIVHLLNVSAPTIASEPCCSNEVGNLTSLTVTFMMVSFMLSFGIYGLIDSFLTIGLLSFPRCRSESVFTCVSREITRGYRARRYILYGAGNESKIKFTFILHHSGLNLPFLNPGGDCISTNQLSTESALLVSGLSKENLGLDFYFLTLDIPTSTFYLRKTPP